MSFSSVKPYKCYGFKRPVIFYVIINMYQFSSMTSTSAKRNANPRDKRMKNTILWMDYNAWVWLHGTDEVYDWKNRKENPFERRKKKGIRHVQMIHEQDIFKTYSLAIFRDTWSGAMWFIEKLLTATQSKPQRNVRI